MEEERRGRSRLEGKDCHHGSRRDQRTDGTGECVPAWERLEGRSGRSPMQGWGGGWGVGGTAGLCGGGGAPGEGRQGGGAAGLRGWRGPQGRGGSSLRGRHWTVHKTPARAPILFSN